MKRKDPYKSKINIKYLKESLDLKKFIKLISTKNLKIKWNNKENYYFTHEKNSWKDLKYKILKSCADHNIISEYLSYRIDNSYPGNIAWNVSFETKLQKGLLLTKLTNNFKLDYLKKFSIKGSYKSHILRKCKALEEEYGDINDFFCNHMLFSSKIDKCYYLILYTNMHLELSEGSHKKKGWNQMNHTNICDIHQKFNDRNKAIKFINKREKNLSIILKKVY